MKVKYIFLISLIVVMILPNLPAQDCLVEYIDGKCEIKQGNTWEEVFEGDVLPLTGVIKTHEHTIVELNLDHQLYTISAEGIYTLETVISNREDSSAWNIPGMVEKKIARIIEDEMTETSAAMGVRAEEIGETDGIKWMESSDYIVWEGQKLIDKGEYKVALDYFQDAFLNALDETEENEYLFYIGYCYSLLGEKTLALTTLSKVEVQTDTPYYGHYVLLHGHLLAESLSYKRALDLAEPYLKIYPEGEYAQAVNFLCAFCFKRLNNREKALLFLKQTHELDPLSPLGREAEKQIKHLKKD